MVVLCRELLTSDLFAGFLVVAFVSLGRAVSAEFVRRQFAQSLDEGIEYMRNAVAMCPPGSHFEAMALLETILDHKQPRVSGLDSG
ncbi:hypothetical protein BJY52DRAFT_1255653 [Lactarius psammicola]|nr:hypothetical protein BJY52DRAFT_1255653 [Lactarius psammicola]